MLQRQRPAPHAHKPQNAVRLEPRAHRALVALLCQRGNLEAVNVCTPPRVRLANDGPGVHLLDKVLLYTEVRRRYPQAYVVFFVENKRYSKPPH